MRIVLALLLLAGLVGPLCVAWWRSRDAFEAVQARLAPGSIGPGLDIACSRGVLDVWVGKRTNGASRFEAVRMALPGAMPEKSAFHVSIAESEARLTAPLWLPVTLGLALTGWLIWPGFRPEPGGERGRTTL